MEFYNPDAFLTVLRTPSPKKRAVQYGKYRDWQQQQLRQWILENAQKHTKKRPMRSRQIALDVGCYPYYGERHKGGHVRADLCQDDLRQLVSEGLLINIDSNDHVNEYPFTHWIANPDHPAFKQMPPTSPVAPAQTKDDLATVLQPRRRSGQNAN